MRIWKLCFIDETTNKTEVFNSTEILDDKTKRRFYNEALEWWIRWA